jgi:hypothetical protein
MSQSIQLLLDKAAIIQLRQEVLQSEYAFNIFQVLRAGHEEVSLHSRFLYELLNPRGSHGMGDVFLRCFAKICSLPDLSYDNVYVMREHANIDILIRDNNHAIIIENKIYASDQFEQLKRYYKYAESLHLKPYLLYLTLDGREPPEHSISYLLEKVNPLSYSVEIRKWLTACVQEAAMKPTLRETIIQYQHLIAQLTGGTMDEAEKQQILSLLAKGDNAENAAIIARNWNHVRWHTEWDFWNELLASIKNKYEISPIGKFSSDALDKMIHERRGRNPWYGLSFVIGSIHNSPISIRIERNTGSICYGLRYGDSDDDTRTRMRLALRPLSVQQHSEWWAGLKSANAGIDFENFNNSITLQLANPERRKIIVSELWQEMQEFTNEVTILLKEQFGADFISFSISHV